MLTAQQGQQLILLARQSISRKLGMEEVADVDTTADWLQQPAATFVTLTQHGQLRGCIGSLEAWRPLLEDIIDNAYSAAFRDPRFEPVEAHEWPMVKVEVSLLTPASPLHFSSEADALSQLRPGTDGLILEHGHHRGTFLPQVWETLPQARDFLNHLKQKAGLPSHFWADDLRLYRYEVQKWKQTN